MRIDTYLFQNNKYSSRTKAAEAIARGEVFVNGKIVKKPSLEVEVKDIVEIVVNSQTFVSNGGYKLEKAFEDFKFSAEGLNFADVGASTGGFTDCLLKHGASKVYAIDVGESLLSNDLKQDDRVVCDVSFISLTYVLAQIYSVLKDNGFAVVLIKPQFECGKKELNKNGIVTDKKARVNCVKKILDFAQTVGFSPINLTNAPIKLDKNREYLLFLSKSKAWQLKFTAIENLI